MTHMQISSSLSVVTGDLDSVIDTAPLKPFSDEVIAFLDDLSKLLMAEKGFSDIVSLGFWIRRASMMKEKAKYDDINVRLGRGIAFHIAPSNVAVNFAFSLVMGLLSGNANIVRLPSNEFAQTGIITCAISKLLSSKHKSLSPYICLVKYPVSKDISDKLSRICDVRVIWGGDRTVKELRLSPLKPRASDIAFADRYSIAIINADAYLADVNKEGIAKDFYNDTYYNDQNACSAPSAVFWMGTNIDEARPVFWDHIRKMAQERYPLSAVQLVGKLSALYRAAVNIDCLPVEVNDNYLTCIEIKGIDENLTDYRYHSGFFFECRINKLSEILPICNDKLQTLVYYGVESDEIEAFLFSSRPRGIDRVVPMGKSMDFSLIWDGHDIIREMSRRVVFV